MQATTPLTAKTQAQGDPRVFREGLSSVSGYSRSYRGHIEREDIREGIRMRDRGKEGRPGS